MAPAPDMSLSLRPLDRADAPAYKQVRLRALREDPAAFTSSYETCLAQPDSFFVQRATFERDNFIYGAFDSNELVAIAGGYVDPELKRDHIGYVVGVWTDPAHRNQALARKLTQQVIDQLRTLEHLRMVQLSVTLPNPAAITVYEKLGFSAWGTEPDALRTGGQIYDELHMALSLR